jgi:soluble lytic murein transglycosylase-like protein
MRGQATVAIVIALALGGALALLVAERARLAVERAHAQRAADAAVLAAVLEGPLDPGRQRAAADRAAARAAARVVRLDIEGGRVRVLVRLARRQVVLPALLGGGRVGLAAAARAEAEGDPAALLPAAAPAAYAQLVRDAARTEGLPAALLAAQLQIESGFDPHSVSSAGAQGIAQFMPGTWSGSWNPWRLGSPFDPTVAIRAQARLMAGLLRQFGGDVERALAAYNAGPGRARQAPESWPAETRAYVPAVLALAGTGHGGARLVR